jgi:hypothetical protein
MRKMLLLLAAGSVFVGADATRAATPHVAVSVDAGQGRKAISPWIYGINEGQVPGAPVTSRRLGGNRWTAYNWETNESNAGSDYLYQNDQYLSSSLTPGAAVLPTIQSTATAKQAAVVTIPMAGFVSGDHSGPVATADYARLNATNPASDGTPGTRFKISRAAKGSAFSLTPNATDGFVYQDEFVNWVKANQGVNRTAPVMFSLDNEPDLWSSTHAEIRRNAAGTASQAVTYQELRDRTVQYATAIKNVWPEAPVLGPVSYGFNGYISLQNASDAGGRDFINYYLQQMNTASQAAGKRLVDALDLHYYPEARATLANGSKVRIIDSSVIASTDPNVIAARVNAPRSLYDPTYVEDSWITQDYLRYSENPASIKLLPRMQGKIDANYAGTKQAYTEYDFGGGNHITGAVAEADALGAFGANGVYLASVWAEQSDMTYIAAAFKMFQNFDGQGGSFGDTSVTASSANIASISAYASLDSANATRAVLVLINRTGSDQVADLSLANLPWATDFSAWRIMDGNPTPTFNLKGKVAGGALSYTLAPYSVNTVVVTGFALVPEPRGGGGAIGGGAVLAGVMLRRRR